MQTAFNPDNIGEQLGAEGVTSVVTKVEEYCAYEIQRIALTNEPAIMALRAEGALLMEEKRDLKERVKDAPTPRNERGLRRKTAYHWAVTAILAIAGFVFSLVAFDPYRLGWKGYVYSAGIAVVTPFLVEKVLEYWHAERFLRWLAASATVSALVSLVLLATIRGDLLAHSFATETVVVLDEAGPQPPPETDFYAKTLPLLRLVMALLALAMEIGAGLALHEAWKACAPDHTDWDGLRARLVAIHTRLTALTYEIMILENEPGVFAAHFWRDFYRAMIAHTVRSAITKLSVLLFALAFLPHHAAAAEHTTIVVALDLTQSVAVTGPSETSEFQKNVDGVTRLLTQAPANSRITVLGITDRSFAVPFILLTATIPDDPGYFGERLTAARTQLVRVWKTRTAHLTARFPYTDILGALLLAGQVFTADTVPGRKVLVIFSDMRHHTRELNLETRSIVPPFVALLGKPGMGSVAAFQRVRVSVLGADGAGKSIRYWESLEGFWTGYFENAGATVERYSVLRELPTL